MYKNLSYSKISQNLLNMFFQYVLCFWGPENKLILLKQKFKHFINAESTER